MSLARRLLVAFWGVSSSFGTHQTRPSASFFRGELSWRRFKRECFCRRGGGGGGVRLLTIMRWRILDWKRSSLRRVLCSTQIKRTKKRFGPKKTKTKKRTTDYVGPRSECTQEEENTKKDTQKVRALEKEQKKRKKEKKSRTHWEEEDGLLSFCAKDVLDNAFPLLLCGRL